MKHKSRTACLMAAALVLTVTLGGCGNHDAQQDSPAHAATPAAAATARTEAADATHAHFTITGTSLGLKDGTTMTLLEMDANPERMDSSIKLASAKVENGRFTLTGSVDQPMRGVLTWGSHASVGMIIENATYHVVNTGAGLAVKGGHYNDLVYGYRTQPDYIAAEKKRHAVSEKAFAHVDPMDKAAMTAARKAVSPSVKAVRKIENAYQGKILDGDGPALLKLFVLPDNYDWKRYPPAKRKVMYASYKEALGDNPVLRRVQYVAEMRKSGKAAQNALAVGKPYRDITATSADGKKVKLSDVLAKNKLVLVDFWASWCSPCRAEFPHLAKTYKEFHKDGFEIYAVSLDDNRSDWLKALKEERASNNIPWINLEDAGMDSTSATAYGVQRLPSNFLISGDGKIVGKNIRDWGVENAVRKHFGKLSHESR